MLRQYIEGIEFGQERIDPRETKQQQVDLALEEAKDLLERVRADDDSNGLNPPGLQVVTKVVGSVVHTTGLVPPIGATSLLL